MKSDIGLAVLAESGHFSIFCNFLKMFDHNDVSADQIKKLKGALLTIGYTGTTERGLNLVEKYDGIGLIQRVLFDSKVLSVKAYLGF